MMILFRSVSFHTFVLPQILVANSRIAHTSQSLSHSKLDTLTLPKYVHDVHRCVFLFSQVPPSCPMNAPLAPP